MSYTTFGTVQFLHNIMFQANMTSQLVLNLEINGPCQSLCIKSVLTTAAADCLNQSTALSVPLDSRGHAEQHVPHRGMTGATSLHVVEVTRHRDL